LPETQIRAMAFSGKKVYYYLGAGPQNAGMFLSMIFFFTELTVCYH
jgi:hypothetical protein